jgi:hypothetical protein
MKHGIELEIEGEDWDCVDLTVRGSNGLFAGTTSFYSSPKELRQLADAIRGFPIHSEDRREFVLGDPRPERVWGHARFRLHCMDSAGNVVLEVELRAERNGMSMQEGRAEFTLRVEAAAIDRFVATLMALPFKRGDTAYLPQSV